MKARGTTAFVGSLVVLVAGAAVVRWIGASLKRTPEPNHAQKQIADAPGTQKPPSAPPREIDPATSLLGTASSMSPDALALTLVSTSPGSTPREGTAMLGTDSRNPQTYAAGATLANGAVIREVHADHIVLELAGKRSDLPIGGKSAGANIAQLLGTDSGATTVGGAGMVDRPLDNAPSSREDLSEILRPVPVYEGEKFVGLKMLPGSNGATFAALGLAPGDVVRGIEGKQLKSPDESWQMLDDALSTGTSIVVSIERDGNLTSIFLDGARLTQTTAIPPGI